MRKIKGLLIIAILITSPNLIKCQTKGKVIYEYVPSTGIKNNIFGDTANPKVIVYLPPSYNKSDTTKYPVLYYLTGSFTEVDHMFDGSTPHIMNEYLDSLINNKIIREMIVVVASSLMNLPGAKTRMPTFFLNSSINGNWEDFIVYDLISFIDNKYCTINSRLARGLTGHSLGGYATIRLALLYPDKFGYAYSMSFGISDKPLYTGTYDQNMDETQVYKRNTLFKLKEESEKTSFENGLLLFNKLAEDKRMFFTLSLGTSFAPRQDMKSPFFYIPLKKHNDSIIADTSILKFFINNPDMYIDSLILKYKKMNIMLHGLVMEVGLYDSESPIYGCNYTSSQFIKNKIAHEVIYTNYAHVNALKYRVINYMLPYFSRHLGVKLGDELYNP